MILENLTVQDFLPQSPHPKPDLMAVTEGRPENSTLFWNPIWHKVYGYNLLGKNMDPADIGRGLCSIPAPTYFTSKVSQTSTTRKCSFCRSK